jgi:hypothetical protein
MLKTNGRKLSGQRVTCDSGRQDSIAVSVYLIAARLSCVLGMFSSLEVKVLRPT